MQSAVGVPIGVSVGPRALAIIIDAIILAVVGGILILILKNAGTALYVILAILYFPVMEKVWGATVGKMAIGLRVVMEDGVTPLNWGASIIRNLLRIIDGLFIYLVGSILVWTSPRRQRLGDRAGHTLVVRKNQAAAVVPSGQF